MTPIRVAFKTRIMNPDFRYGDIAVEAQLEVAGSGLVVAFPSSGNAVVVSESTGKFYLLGLSEIIFTEFLNVAKK